MEALEATPDATGARYRVLSRGKEEESDGGASSCRVEQLVRASTPGFDPQRFPGGPPPHAHVGSDETFTVVSGKMGLWVEGADAEGDGGGAAATVFFARAGESTPTIRAGKTHTFYNAGARDGDDLLVTFELRPCNDAPSFFENLAGLVADVGGGSLRRVGALQVALLYADHGAELRGDAAAIALFFPGRGGPQPAWLPRWAGRAAAALLPPVARALGYKARYKAYESAGGRRRAEGSGGGGDDEGGSSKEAV